MPSIVKRGQNFVKTLFGTYFDPGDYIQLLQLYDFDVFKNSIKKGHPSILRITL
jgi:hypothetical protein